MYGELVDYQFNKMYMKELSINILVTPCTKMRKESYRFIADEFSLAPTIENSSAGNLFNCSTDIVIDRPDKDTLQEFASGRKVTVQLTDTSNGKVVLGNNDLPAIVSICPYLNSARLKIECKMLQSPFSR